MTPVLVADRYEPLPPHRDPDVDVHKRRAQQASHAADRGEYGHLPEVPPEHSAVVRLVVGEQAKVPVHPELGTRKVHRVKVELIEPVRGEHARARGEEAPPQHAGAVEAGALLHGEQHAADGCAERHRDADGGSDGDEITLIGVIAKVRRFLGPKTQSVAAKGAEPAAHKTSAVDERPFFPGDQSGTDAERDAAQLGPEGLDPQQTPEVHAVEVRFQFRDAGARGEGLDVGHQPARDGGEEAGDDDPYEPRPEPRAARRDGRRRRAVLPPVELLDEPVHGEGEEAHDDADEHAHGPPPLLLRLVVRAFASAAGVLLEVIVRRVVIVRVEGGHALEARVRLVRLRRVDGAPEHLGSLLVYGPAALLHVDHLVQAVHLDVLAGSAHVPAAPDGGAAGAAQVLARTRLHPPASFVVNTGSPYRVNGTHHLFQGRALRMRFFLA